MRDALVRGLLPVACLFAVCGAVPRTAFGSLDKEQIKKDFESWYAKTNQGFEEDWARIKEAEAAAQPSFDEAAKLAEAGKHKKAITLYLKARNTLYNHPSGGLVHINKGMSFNIAMSLAELYETLEDEPRLKRELTFMDKGRPWMSKDKEQQIFLYHAIREVFRVYNYEEYRNEGKRMKTKQRKRLHRIVSYVVVGGGDVLFEEGYKLGKS